MLKNCEQCGEKFEVTDRDMYFLDKISPVIAGVKYTIPDPTHCYLCRLQRKMPWRAELHLFRRKSDYSEKPMLSFFPPDAPYKVYSMDEWRNDTWDACEYGRDFDFSRPFFEQFAELMKAVPIPGLSEFSNENSDFINNAAWNKNCYLIAAGNNNESCYYGNFINFCNHCMDSCFLQKCELCFECIDCTGCYNLKYSQNCHSCSDSYFLHNCKNSKNCFGCVNLINKEFVYFNEQLTKKEYEKRVATLRLNSKSGLKKVAEYFEKHRLKYPYKDMNGEMNENASGQEVGNCRNVENCFDVSNLEDCKNCNWLHNGKDCMDVYSWGLPVETCYECIEVGEGNQNSAFCSTAWTSDNVYYSYYAISSQYLFGCVSAQRKKYCILNKQYTKEEWEELVPRIIEHMKQTGEFGEFFPYRVAPLNYNQSIAQDYFPLSKEDAEKLGARWADEPEYKIPDNVSLIPDSIDEADDSICNQMLHCSVTGRPYKIIPQELAFYKKHGIPMPDICLQERHKRRLAKRHRRRLYDRQCAKCRAGIQTAYSPERPEIIYCEECYLAEIY